MESLIIYIGMIILSFSIVNYSEKIGEHSKKIKLLNEKKVELLNQRKIFFFIASLFPIFLSAIRYNVGTDYLSYYDKFYYFEFESIFDIFRYTNKFEPAYLLIMYISKTIFNSPYVFFFISSFLINALIFKAAWRRKSYIPVSYTCFLFLCLQYGYSLNIVRQFMAMGFILLAFEYIEKKQPMQYLLMILLATMFHYTAIIVLPFYVLSNDKWRKKFIYIGIFLVIFILTNLKLIEKIIDLIPFLANYKKYINFNGSINLKNIFSVLFTNFPIILLMCVYGRRLMKANKFNINYMFYCIVGILLKLLSFTAPHINRVSNYFDIVQIFLIPQIINFTTNKYEKLILKILIIIYGIFMFIYKFYICNGGEIFPYITMFS